jgi:glycosyltransferase involved in cell wall biosynthesis
VTDRAANPASTPAEAILPAASATPALTLTVIIPARNEERLLPACLASLLAQSEPGFALGPDWELLIVDDESTDRTPEILRELAAQAATTHPGGVTLLTPPPLDLTSRGGFTGKNNACWAAAQVARGRWLLFTDADTLHEPGNLSRALHEAEKYHAALLSYSPRQLVTGFGQRIVMPLVFSELASVYPPKQVSDPTRSIAAANGQFLLAEREAYFSAGGHRAVGREILEDIALARNLKRIGNLRFRYAPDALSTRMYLTFPEMVEGWTKNLALLFPQPLLLAAFRLLDILLFLGIPAVLLAMPYLVTWQRAAVFLLWVRTLWRFYSRVARSNFSALDCALSILGVPLFIYLLLRSVLHHRIHKRLHWKGRRYPTNP